MGTVSDIAPAFVRQRAEMQLVHDLCGGTQAMKDAGERYLFRGEAESDAEFALRLKNTALLNAYVRTLRFMRGQVFKKPVSIEDTKEGDLLDKKGVEWFQAWAENVDRQGANLSTWAGHAFSRGINDGVTFCLVDFDVSPDAGEVVGRQAEGKAPYLVLIPAEKVLDCRMAMIDGRQQVVHFRYVEDVYTEKDEFTLEKTQRIRLYTPGLWRTFDNAVDSQGTFEPSGEGEMRDAAGNLLPFVPLCLYMPGEKRTDATAEPAMQDLAWLNLRHWQASSSQAALMEFVRRPVWFGKGLGDGETPIAFGPGRLISCSDVSSALVNLGVDAGSVAAGRQELQDIEAQMALYGLQLLEPNHGMVTATEISQESEESLSTLQEWATRFQDFLENCLFMAALWQGWPDGPSVKVNTDLTRTMNTEMLVKLQEQNVLSKGTLMKLLVRDGILPDDFDAEEEKNALAQELNTVAGAAGPLDLNAFLNGAKG
ncbi:MAG: DUF4055 domain-containing protein [Desulfovibrionaceae bacterium]|nr:DUF4055 domain-containing protein [Desulfovibrionaceae bacterium]